MSLKKLVHSYGGLFQYIFKLDWNILYFLMLVTIVTENMNTYGHITNLTLLTAYLNISVHLNLLRSRIN